LVIARYATPTNQYFIYVLVTIVLIALAYGMLKLEGKIMRRIQKAGK
jgi:small neutral amino acid transporter SnatA (MarC family)